MLEQFELKKSLIWIVLHLCKYLFIIYPKDKVTHSISKSLE